MNYDQIKSAVRDIGASCKAIADVAKDSNTAGKRRANEAISSACSAVANIIGASPRVQQQGILNAAAAAGFSVSYYASGIRVAWGRD